MQYDSEVDESRDLKSLHALGDNRGVISSAWLNKTKNIRDNYYQVTRPYRIVFADLLVWTHTYV